MTENYNKNRQNYLDLCNKVWNLDDESMKYLEKRLSDDWEPVPEFKTLIDALKEKGATYEDQRVMIDIDVADNLVISDISNAGIDINKATNVDNYLLNIDESQCDLMSFCQFLNKNESFFLADCNKLSKEVLKLIELENDDPKQSRYDLKEALTENKLEVKLKRQIPMYHGIDMVYRLQRSNKYYKLDKNMLSVIPIGDIADWVRK